MACACEQAFAHQWQGRFQRATDGIFSEDSLRAYYDRHPDEFTLERPLVRGIYLKVPSDAPNLGTLRRLYTSSKSEDTVSAGGSPPGTWRLSSLRVR